MQNIEININDFNEALLNSEDDKIKESITCLDELNLNLKFIVIDGFKYILTNKKTAGKKKDEKFDNIFEVNSLFLGYEEKELDRGIIALIQKKNKKFLKLFNTLYLNNKELILDETSSIDCTVENIKEFYNTYDNEVASKIEESYSKDDSISLSNLSLHALRGMLAFNSSFGVVLTNKLELDNDNFLDVNSEVTDKALMSNPDMFVKRMREFKSLIDQLAKIEQSKNIKDSLLKSIYENLHNMFENKKDKEMKELIEKVGEDKTKAILESIITND